MMRQNQKKMGQHAPSLEIMHFFAQGTCVLANGYRYKYGQFQHQKKNIFEEAEAQVSTMQSKKLDFSWILADEF